MRRGAFLPLVACVAALAGCAPNLRYTLNRVDYDPMPDDMLSSAQCSSPLRVCVTNEQSSGFTGSVNSDRTKVLATRFARVVRRTNPTTNDCDIAVTFTATMNDNFDASSVATKAFLARLEGNGAWNNAAALCVLLNRDSGLAAKVSGAAPPAAAPSANAPPAGAKTWWQP